MKWQHIGNIAGRNGIDGKDAKSIDQQAIVDAVVARIPAPKDGADGKDGSSVTADQVRAMVADELRTAVANIPAPRDGKDADPEVMRTTIADMVKQIPAPRDGRDGKDAEPMNADDLAALVSKAVDALLPGMLTKAIEVASADWVAKAAALIPKPADGRDGRDGVSGSPGRDGVNGIDGSPGQKGADGQDGMSIEDFDATLKDGKIIVLSLKNGEKEIVREIPLAIPVDRGVYKSGAEYLEGDCVTYAGSLWIAQRNTKASPGNGDDFRLAVKRGRDGKDAV